MFRSDRDALAEEVERLRLQQQDLEGQNEAMRASLLARRMPQQLATNPYLPGAEFDAGEIMAMKRSQVARFPVWGTVLLHFATLGLFPFIHLNMLHGRLPQLTADDPSPGKAIGFTFIPYFNLYWMVFNTRRLVDRMNLQFRLRGRPEPLSREFMTVVAVLGLIPYVGVLSFLFLWPIAAGMLQSAANELATIQDEERDLHAAPQPPARLRAEETAELPGGHEDPFLAEAEREVEEALGNVSRDRFYKPRT